MKTRSVAGETVAPVLEPVVRALLGPDPGLRFEFWDGSALGPPDATVAVRLRSPDALRRLVWAPSQLGLGRAYVSGEIEVDGDLFTALERLRDAAPGDLRFGLRALPPILSAAHRLDGVGRPPRRPPEEARLHGRRHTRARDARAISRHYDVGEEFYRIVLGPALSYSAACFADDRMDLADAQTAKHELICRKLGLAGRAGRRLLDVGCGWGSLALHAARHHGARVVGVTISAEQEASAAGRVRAGGLEDRIEIRRQDYRTLAGETFDAISSVGMFEHVGRSRMDDYFATLHRLLAPEGRLLNSAISCPGGSKLGRRSFMGRYVFPDGELIDVGEAVAAMERAGFEVRDVESLREHYARTLRAWVANLDAGWDRAVALAGPGRARVWRLYMAASAVGFEDGGLNVHQVLAVRPAPSGQSGMPATRAAWVRGTATAS